MGFKLGIVYTMGRDKSVSWRYTLGMKSYPKSNWMLVPWLWTFLPAVVKDWQGNLLDLMREEVPHGL